MNPLRIPRRWWAIVAACGLGLLLAMAVRYGILENEAQARLCEEASGGWCTLREAVGWTIYMQLFGWAALIMALLAWIPRWRRLALGALFLAGCGLFVYNATFAAAALVIGMLAAIRPPARPAGP